MRGRIFLRGALADLGVFGLLCSLLGAVLYAALGDIGYAYLSLVLIVPFAGMFFLRRLAGHIVVFVLGHLILCEWPLLLPAGRFPLLLRVLWTVFLGLLLVYSFVARLHVRVKKEDMPVQDDTHMDLPNLRIDPKIIGVDQSAKRAARGSEAQDLPLVPVTGAHGIDRGFAVVATCAYAILGALGEAFGYREGAPLLAFWALFTLLGMLLSSQTARIDDSLEVLSEMRQKPVRTILRFNNLMLAAFLAVALVFALFALRLPVDKAGMALGAVLLFLLRHFARAVAWFINLFPRREEQAAVEAPVEEAAQEDMGLPPAGETPAWMEILDMVMRFVFQAVIVAGLVALVGYAVFKLVKRFYQVRPTADGDVREYAGPDLSIENVKTRVAGAAAFLRRLAARTEEEKIRRRYYKRIRRHILRGAPVRNADTTGEIYTKVAESDNEASELEGLTQRYDQARYGGSGGAV